MTDRTPASADHYSGIHSDIVTLLEAARRATARSVNALMTATYWEIGRRIVECEFQKYRIVQDRLFESDFDRMLKQLESDDPPNKDED